MNKTTGTLLALALILNSGITTAAHADSWGDTSYSPESESQVEEIPASLATDESMPITEDALAQANSNSYEEPKAEEKDQTLTVKSEDIAPAKSSSRSSFSNISTVRNTYGVETEERPPVKFYASPFGGMTSMFGNTTADASPKFAAGASVGALISSRMLVEVGYTYAEQNLSNPRYNTASGILMGTGVANVFALKQNSFDAGVKFFFLGRESRFRPFFGGGAGYTRSYMNYTPNYQQSLGFQSQYMSDFITNQVTGFGEIGAEFAITRAIVLTAMFKLNGVLSSSTSASDSTSAQAYDPSKLEVGNSLSRTASYTIGAGMGFYF